MPLLKKARSPNNPRFLDYLVTWQSEFATVPHAYTRLNTGTPGTRLNKSMLVINLHRFEQNFCRAILKYTGKKFRFFKKDLSKNAC